ncbi:transmembrane protein 51b [Cyprinodon tularosa]|uniref:transmembrane protein 51b n=1 Tax=Cyprinodon tularosa TaxID=77115 RepID=UPI0018E24058|nr:transmembrane protein 51b [Cyprinodon tularosa]XP_038125344.1 transmembrane protein 51b [Cyprinodon tularosa]
MCSSPSICGGNNRPNRSSSETRGSGAHYALCALGVGLIALGIVMIVWTVIPEDALSGSTNSTSLGTKPDDDEEEDNTDRSKSSSVALVLVGVGIVMLLLSICLGLRSKRRARNQNQSATTGEGFMDHVAGVEQPTVDPEAYNVPSYEEVVASGNYPVRQSNLRQSTSQLPSYEDILAAVENEGSQPANNSTENSPLNDQAPAGAQPPAEPSSLTSQPSLPTRSASRASRLLKPLRVRRIKSDKLHLKDFRLQIRTPTQNPVTIEPITPPPGYENKLPELQ